MGWSMSEQRLCPIKCSLKPYFPSTPFTAANFFFIQIQDYTIISINFSLSFSPPFHTLRSWGSCRPIFQVNMSRLYQITGTTKTFTMWGTARWKLWGRKYRQHFAIKRNRKMERRKDVYIWCGGLKIYTQILYANESSKKQRKSTKCKNIF